MTDADRRQILWGVAFALLAVGLTATTDLLAKLLAAGFPFQQVNFLAALVGIAGSWVMSLKRGGGAGLRTAYPRAMALRAFTTVGAAVGFFLAYKHLMLTEVFVLSATLPIFAGLMSGPILGERVALRHWLALAASFLGVALVLPAPGGGQALWYGVGLGASFLGALSLTLARRIGRHERNAAALVFYPQIALALSMAFLLPGHMRPMSPADLGLTLLFGLGFLWGKMALAAAFSRAPAMVVTPVVNLQFFALLGLGWLAFGNVPGPAIYLGAAIVTAAGLYLGLAARAPAQASARPLPLSAARRSRKPRTALIRGRRKAVA
ncbi:DMT family transporter [Acidimangrovimonas sediminis]|uniref:DMT family transporter n=1 Tax=Acidimangrovimonas sediminis TaxID=2056283 RepID=UPI000C805DB5|nr:DMT family transporter [Acidimangrovimonas sediminis]